LCPYSDKSVQCQMCNAKALSATLTKQKWVPIVA